MKITFFHNDEIGLIHTDLTKKPSSGTVSSLLNLAKGLAILNHDVVILSKAKTCKIHNINYVEIKETNELITWYKENNTDVLVTVGHANNVLPLLVKYKKSRIYHWHHNYLDIKHVVTLLKKNKIDGIVTVSPHHMSSLYKYFILNKITYIRNAIDYDLLAPYKRNIQHRNGLAFVGNISKSKGFDEVINAYFEYINSGGKEILHIYGSTNLYNKNMHSSLNFNEFEVNFYEKINMLKTKNKLVFHGKLPRDILYKELNKRKLLLCGLNKTGGAESAGIGMIEAQYMGCHVITYNRGGQKDSVYKKNNVIRISSDITKKISNVLNDKNDYIKNSFFERYDFINIANEWVSLFQGKKNNKKHFFAIKSRISGI
ncbi:glycosyltransferase, partial [Proteus mirabilis]|nr:glycosyltransferase [Proteus mirabilis]